MKKRRVLIIAANDMGNSGVPNVYMQIVRNLSDEFIFDILITREDYYYKDEFLSFGGQIFLFKERDYKNKSKRLWWRQFGLPKATKKFLKTILQNNKYDIIHSFKESESWMFLKEAKKFGIGKRVIHNNRQNDKCKRFAANLFTNRAIKKSIKYSNSNISVSRESGKSFFGNSPFSVVHNTYNENVFKYSDELQGDYLVMQVGTFLPLKNQIFSLKVLEKIKAKCNNIKFAFIGSIYDKEYYQRFIETINSLGLKDDVIIYNNNVDQKAIIKKAIATFVPSLKEGLSLTAIEAQACGIRVFASNGVPKDTDLGNITYCDLVVEQWADSFVEYFSNKMYRKKVNMKDFTNTSFRENIKKIYN